jgi:hypothetical protein
VGIADVGGVPQEKWKTTFYSLLDMDNRHRIQMGYDKPNNLVRITFPVAGSDVQPTWIYDPDSDRVWLDQYQNSPTCFGAYNTPAGTAQTIDGAAGSIDDFPGSYDDYTVTFSLERFVHGTVNGLVMIYQRGSTTQDTLPINYRYETVTSGLGNQRTLKTTDRVVVEHLNTDNSTGMTVEVINSVGGSQSGIVALDTRNLGQVELANQYSRLTSERLGVRLSGTGPVRILGFELDYFDEGEERR